MRCVMSYCKSKQYRLRYSSSDCPNIYSPQEGHLTHNHLRLRVEYTEGVITGIASIKAQELPDATLSVLLSLLLSLAGSESVLETLSHVLEIIVHFAAPVLHVIATVFLRATLQRIQCRGRLVSVVSESGATFSIHGGWL